jgi:hypothetical protein
MRRKRTISERVTGNSDPLVIKKKAREAAKKASESTKKVTQVCFFSRKLELEDSRTFFNSSANIIISVNEMHIVNLALKTSTKIYSLRKLFQKRHPASLNVQMEVKTTYPKFPNQ